TPEVSAIPYADLIIGLLESAGIRKIDLIVNRIRMDMVRRGEMMSVEDVLDILSVDLIGAVPDEESVVIAANHGEPVLGSDTQAGSAYMNIARRVLGETVPLLHLNEHTTLFHRIAAGLLGKK
ncbi:MAG: septum site-determining protein MinD, partial [Clostridiales bacterium]|nr:septum site-determining protein MinD [Clostridiales bacterium]